MGVAEIADATPVPEGIKLLGRFFALVTLIVMFQIALMVGGVLMQVLQGYYRFELGLYIRSSLACNWPNYVLFAALAMAIHVLVNHKYLGQHDRADGIHGSQSPCGCWESPITTCSLYGSDPGWTTQT